MIKDDFSTTPHQSDSVETLPRSDQSTETLKSPELYVDSELTEEKAKEHLHFEAWLGRKLSDRYLLEMILGEGGFGIVFRAKDTKLNRPIVVKVLLKKNWDNEDVIRRFQRESEALARLGSHSGVVGIFDFGETTEKIPFLVIEYVEGKSLRSLMNNQSKNSPFSTNEIKQFSFIQTAEIISQVAEVLAFAHRRGIIHRDIKPENIMLQTDDLGRERVRIIDFGIAKVLESLVEYRTKTGLVPGTICYASPEQLTGEKELTGASDQFSLGVVAYEMLTGELPFQPQNPFEMIRLHQEGVKTLPRNIRPDLPTEAETVLLRALSHNPQNRFPSVTDFSNSLKNSLAKTEPFITKTGIPITEHIILPETEEANLSNFAMAGNSKQNNLKDDNPIKLSSTIVASQTSARISKSKRLLPIVSLFILLLGISAFAFFLWNWQNSEKSNTASAEASSSDSASNTGAIRKMQYWLEVQKMRGKRPFGKSFESSGREIFESGYKFRLNFLGENTGYFYLFNDGKDTDGSIVFSILYPIPLAGKDNALSQKEELVQTDWNEFEGKVGIEKFWLIWTAEKNNVLEDARENAFSQKGEVTDKNRKASLRQFLNEESKQNINAELEKNGEKRRTIITGRGDIIVHLLELEHR